MSGDWLVSEDSGHEVLLTQHADKTTGTYVRHLETNPKDKKEIPKWTPIKGITCPFCGKEYRKKEFQDLTRKKLGDDLLCVRISTGESKRYILPDSVDDFLPSTVELEHQIFHELKLIGKSLPDIELPYWSGIVNPPIYGTKTYSQLFNYRQLAVLLKMIRSLVDLHKTLLSSGFLKKEALAVTSMLSAFIDQLVDWNCRLSMWIEENQQVGRALSGPGIPMLWRYAEIDPFTKSPANLYDKLSRMCKAIESIPRFSFPVHTFQCSATKLPFDSGTYDAIVTDPAYGDNLYYSVLSECVYVWKRMVFQEIFPEAFEKPCIPREDEIVASTYTRSYSEAMSFYEERLTLALSETARVLNKDGILSLFFAHSAKETWESIIRAFNNAGFDIHDFLPILLERRARPRGVNSKAVNVSVVIVAGHERKSAHIVRWNDVEKEVVETISKFERELTSLGWNKEDVALACFVKSIGTVAKYRKVLEDGIILTLKDCIERCALFIHSLFPSLSLRHPNRKMRHSADQVSHDEKQDLS